MTDQLPDVFRGAPTKAQICALKAAMAGMPPLEASYEHHFADGTYTRVMSVPAGAVIVGKQHRFSTINIIAAGSFRATSADGTVQDLHAPHVYVSPPGCEKVILALTDGTWINVHATKLTDVAAIEQKFIVPEAPAIASEERP